MRPILPNRSILPILPSLPILPNRPILPILPILSILPIQPILPILPIWWPVWAKLSWVPSGGQFGQI